MRLSASDSSKRQTCPRVKAATLLLLAFSSPLNPLPVSAFTCLPLQNGDNRLFGIVSINTPLQLTSGVSTNETRDIFQPTEVVFDKFDKKGKGGLNRAELDDVLLSLDMETTIEERGALFNYLDYDGDGIIDFQEFALWYTDVVEAVQSSSKAFRNLLMSRRTVNSFEKTPVSDAVLCRAIECAIAAPNRSGSEPWRFIKVGSKTVLQLQEMNKQVEAEVLAKQQVAPLLPEKWTETPGWCVVTSKITPDDPETELKDFRSTCCAMQNFMLSMWSEGVGSKWTEGPIQKTQQFADIVGVDRKVEKVVGIIWYGFTPCGLFSVDPKQKRKKGVDDVLSILP